MISVVCLDPASLTLWYDASHVSHHPASQEIQEVIHHSIRGEIEDVLAIVNNVDESFKPRLYEIVSSIWHEKRHFVDLLLTNYGSFRVRQFMSLYVNMPTILSEAKQNGKQIVCPIDTHIDPVRSMVFNAEPWSVNLKDIASDVKKRREMLRSDREVLSTKWGNIEVGGDAQLEAMAYYSQFAALEKIFGVNASMDVQAQMSEGQRGNLRYTWATLLGRVTGIESGFQTQGIHLLNLNLLCPIIMVSLMGRFWGQKNLHTDTGGSGFPTERLSALLNEWTKNAKTYSVSNMADGWEVVNQTAKRLWGRTAVEELQADFELEHKYVEEIKKRHEVGSNARLALTDLHELRSDFIHNFIKNPLSYVDPSLFAEQVLFKIRPLSIRAVPGGIFGKPPTGWERVSGYKHPGVENPLSTWWWAIAPMDWPKNDQHHKFFFKQRKIYSLKQRKAWLSIVADFAPMAKLLMNGFRHRTMLGPELTSVFARMYNEGIKITVDPTFSAPQDDLDINVWFTQTQRESATCDICSCSIPRPQGHILSPWLFRNNPDYADVAIKQFGGGLQGHLLFWKDWSPWVICNVCYIKLTGECSRDKVSPVYLGY